MSKPILRTALQMKRGQTWNFVSSLDAEDASLSIYASKATSDIKPSDMKALYEKMKKSGMFWELYPEMTGNWEYDAKLLFRFVTLENN